MTKKRIELSIEEEILEKGKDQIPNMSQFFENCLKAYLGIDIHSMFYTTDAQEAIDRIKEAQTALYLLTERNDVDENIKKAAKQEINLAWRRLYTTYRDTRTIDETLLTNASEILEVSKVELTDIVEVCYAFSRTDEIDVTEWTEVYAQYGGDD